MDNKRELSVLGRAILILMAVGTLSFLSAGTPAIGMAVTEGKVYVDHSLIQGGGSVFEGSLVEAAGSAAQLQLNGGARLRLAKGSRLVVYRERAVLQSGYGQLEGAAGYELQARTLHISPVSADTVARLRVSDDHRVSVAAVQGAVRVANASGMVVANVAAGMSLDFEPQEGGAVAPVRVSGCLLHTDRVWVLAEQTTNIVIELEGEGLSLESGNQVEITGIGAGKPAGPGAQQRIRVAGVKRLASGGCAAVAKKLGTAVPSGGSMKSGGSTTRTVAIIGGVAAASTVGALGAVGEFTGGDSRSTASR